MDFCSSGSKAYRASRVGSTSWTLLSSSVIDKVSLGTYVAGTMTMGYDVVEGKGGGRCEWKITYPKI